LEVGCAFQMTEKMVGLKAQVSQKCNRYTES